MNVLIIPEDFTYDQHILKPLVQAMFRALGKARARVAVCFEPQLGGVEQEGLESRGGGERQRDGQ